MVTALLYPLTAREALSPSPVLQPSGHLELLPKILLHHPSLFLRLRLKTVSELLSVPRFPCMGTQKHSVCHPFWKSHAHSASQDEPKGAYRYLAQAGWTCFFFLKKHDLFTVKVSLCHLTSKQWV